MGGAGAEGARHAEEDDYDEGDSTPKAARTAPRPAGQAASPSPRKLAPPVPLVRSPPKPAAGAPAKAVRAALPAGVTPVELSSAAETIWSTLGEVNGLTRWGRKWAREQDEGEAEKEQRVLEGKSGWEETLCVVALALSLHRQEA